MAKEHWQYVAGAARRFEVDCSGAFTYWYHEAGSYMFHGSNTMWRKYTVKRGKIGEIKLKPGMAVFKWRNDGKEPGQFVRDGLGNFYHVGLYIGNGKVVEAKGTKYGVVESDISKWTHAAELKYTNYDIGDEEPEEDVHDFEPIEGIVNTQSSPLNLRSSASASSSYLARIPKGTKVTLVNQTSDGAWYKTSYNGYTGWVASKYIKVATPSTPVYSVQLTAVGDAEFDAICDLLTDNGFSFSWKKEG